MAGKPETRVGVVVRHIPIAHKRGAKSPLVVINSKDAWEASRAANVDDIVISSHFNPVAAKVEIKVRDFR